jgi:hypothetical protein
VTKATFSTSKKHYSVAYGNKIPNCSVQGKETPHIFQHHCASLEESIPEASSQKQQRFGSTTKPFYAYFTYAITPEFSST